MDRLNHIDRSEVVGLVRGCVFGRKKTTFQIERGGGFEQYWIATEAARAAKLRSLVRAMVLFQSSAGGVVKIVLDPTGQQIQQGVEWTCGGDLPL